jgi:hypothetical protein
VLAILNTLPREEIEEHLSQILYSAVHHREYEIAELALQAGADPNMLVAGQESGFTILMHAALHSLPSIVTLLISYEADVTQHDANGYDALFFCSGNDPQDASNIALILKEQMEKVGFPPQEPLNCTLYETVSKNKRTDVSTLIERLILLGADPQIHDQDNNSLLDISLQQLSTLAGAKQRNSLEEKIKILYCYGAQTKICNMSEYLSQEDIARLEKEKEKLETERADRLYMATKHAEEPQLLELSFFEHHAHTTLEEINEHTPFPQALVQLTHEHLFSTSRPNKRKRQEAS